jgi:predicted SAM-dependent methyltransferase
MKKTALHVGCATLTLAHAPAYFHDGSWREIRYDIDESVRPDIVGTVTDMQGVATHSIDAIYSSHNLEHVFPHEVELVLNEFRRVLKPDGLAIVGVPDLLQVCQLVAQDKLTDTAYTSVAGPITPLDMLYGHLRALRDGKHYMAHKTGFTPKTLATAFFNSGFASVEYLQANFALNMIAYVQLPSAERVKSDKALIFGL